jgi:tetratricopeptide (TPR) repeat protein
MQKCIQESGGIMSKAMVDDMTNPYFEDFVGLGIFLNNFGDDTYLVHGGWNEGFSSELVFHREKGYGVAVMINSNHPDFISELVRSVAQAYNWDGFLPPLYQAQSLSESDLEAVVGRYLYSEDNTVSIYQQDQQLYLKYLRDDPVLLHKIGDNRFIRNHTDTEVLFSPDPQTGLMNIVYIERGSSDEITYEHPKLAEDVLVPYELLMAEDYQGALAAYQELQQNNPEAQDIREWIINRRGYELMGREQYGLAIELFKINTILYPDAFNTYDSLGEAYYEAGNIDLAIINYKKSLDLNPDNQNAKDMLAKMSESS